MKLVVVESPTKARTIGKFLGPDYVIKASMGHIMDLPKSTIGIDFEHGFSPLYEVVKDKKQIISELKLNAKILPTQQYFIIDGNKRISEKFGWRNVFKCYLTGDI